MAFSRTAPLRRELESAFAERPFAVTFWDRTTVPATEPGAPTFALRSPQALAHMLRAPGELGLGRAYVAGLLTVDDLDSAISVVDNFEPPRVAVGQRARLGIAVVRACGLVWPPRRPAIELRLRGRRHTIARDRAAVRYHYNAGNEFFALFLDRSLTYSCAYWSGGAQTLEEAQEAKLELVCRKLGLRDGERVLDVGCGWGSFAIHAASRHGARVLGVTLSEPQAALARQRAGAAGVGDRVEIRVADYREVADGPFDAIASIGMVEHVGEERIDLYARCLAGLLRPGGRLLNHGIAKLTDFEATDEGPISERFVFPDGVPLPLSRVELALERAGFATRHVEGLPDDYARTLRHWLERFESREQDAVRLAGIERVRVWRLYLRAARQAFETGLASVYQVLAHRLM
ncbi:MAG: class I SAM-dependent methyltransferase [Solirubrobacterales bacterium]|nr:class I SAM-dependent methyltransferase [Solirubrobacterales bacterium]MBV9717231.1 class I SAM-dependent methyltransferase [Solirubrobacterales bacterium]